MVLVDMFCIFPGFQSPLLLLICPFTLTGGIYREKLRKKYNSDVIRFGALEFVRIVSRDFDSGIFNCFEGHKCFRKVCFNSLCAPVRLSANASSSGFMDFWSALIMSSIFLPLIFIFGYIHRLYLRDMFGMEPHPVGDFFSWLCCCCCVLTQESKLIDQGYRAIRDDGTIMTVVYIQNPPRVT